MGDTKCTTPAGAPESESLPNSVSGADHDRFAELGIDTTRENKKGGSCHARFCELSRVCIFPNSWKGEVGTGIEWMVGAGGAQATLSRPM